MLISRGNPMIMGCTKNKDGYNFSFANTADKVFLCIYKGAKKRIVKKIELDGSYKKGNVFSCLVGGVSLKDCYYAYEVNGKSVVDPYARAVTGCGNFGVNKKNSRYVCPVEIEEYDWENDNKCEISLSDSIIYKINVRGFTKSRTSGVKNKGTFAGVIEKIDYLKDLGITTLELMPAYEFDEIQRFSNDEDNGIYGSKEIKKPVNYWGYVDGLYFMPKASFTAANENDFNYINEFKDMVKQLHNNGIEVIMEMFFYQKHPAFIADCLKFWVSEYHIDGFHLYGADDCMKYIANDPYLSDTKILTQFWDEYAGSIKHMASYNNKFQNIARQYLKGDENQLRAYTSASICNRKNSYEINYITNNNGFTLYDLVSFDRKHNEINGENNRDGENFNYSWNCGEEGKSRKKRVRELRKKQIKNAFMMVMLSQGTPLILAGDEMCNSQNGNNNPYCVDSEISWVTWNDNALSSEIHDWVKQLILMRKKYKILHMDAPLQFADRLSCGYPDISYHGSSAWFTSMENFDRHVGIMYSCKYADESSRELIYIAYNMHWEKHELALPKLNDTKEEWQVVLCSADEENKAFVNNDTRTVTVMPRSIAVLKGCFGKRGKDIKKDKKEKPEE